MALPTTIDEFNWLDEKVHATTERYVRQFGVAPTNVSHWDPSEETRRSLAPLIKPPPVDAIKYFYSCLLPSKNLIRPLGFEPCGEKFCLITPGGTASMMAIVNLLRLLGTKTLHVLCPFYFPLRYQCESLGVQTCYLSMERTGNTFRLPSLLSEMLTPGDALWITNPVYCTGVYLHENDIDILRSILRSGHVVIADESLALKGHGLSASLGGYSGFCGIYSPHKALSLNGMKFSALVTDQKYELLLESWADVLYGSLTASSVAAMKHFLSSAFDSYQEAFLKLVNNSTQFLQAEVRRHDHLTLDASAQGHYLTCYIPDLPAGLGDDSDFLWRTARRTGAVFIAGTRNHFDPAWGLNFRVNLMLDSPQFRSAMTRLLEWLAARPMHPG